jgi:microcystin-dependent protein
MGLEVATYVSQLTPTNPLAGDKKHQGDDHLRLLKSTLQSTFPNASKPFYFPSFVNKNANYNVLATDDNLTFLLDASAGGFSLNLPAGLTSAGWGIRVVRIDSTNNGVFVVPPSGTINNFAKIRVSVPFSEQIFVWTGTGFFRPQGGELHRAGSIEMFAGNLPIGYGLADGQSLLRADFPELFGAWSTIYGAADGTHFNAPDLRNRFIVGAGASYGLGATGGSDTVTLTPAEMPSHIHGVTDPGHLHGGIATPLNKTTQFAGFSNPGGQAWFGTGADTSTAAAATGISIQAAGADAAHENRPPYTALNLMFRHC